MAQGILVTGALGHIGSALIRELPCAFPDTPVTMVDDLSTQRYGSLFDLPHTGAGYRFLEGRVQDIDLDALIAQSRAVVHLAALTDAAGTAEQPERVFDNNFEATQKLVACCTHHGVPLLFPSSTSVYGSQSDLVDETCAELAPQSPYADCKIKEESALQEYFQRDLKGTILRLGTICGTSPGMRFHTAVNKFCWQAVVGQELTVWETALDQKRPYLCLGDAVRGFIHIIQRQLFSGEVYNVVSDNYTVREIINRIKTHIPQVKIKLVQHKIMNQLSYEVAREKIEKTGFSFQGRIEEDIKETIHLLAGASKIS